jgi:hypothetical protein
MTMPANSLFDALIPKNALATFPKKIWLEVKRLWKRGRGSSRAL